MSCRYRFVVSLALLRLVDAIAGLRVMDEEEKAGLNLSQNSEAPYGF